jgi:hypothetical protein
MMCFVGLMIAGTSAPSVAVADDGDASAYVVHGIPGQDLDLDPALPVDVSVDGMCALPGFTFGEIVGPISLPEGIYAIAISLENGDEPCANDPVIEAEVELMGGTSYSIVAFLTEDGAPTAGLFTNDLSPTGRGKARVIAHHTAAAPPVDISVRRDNPWSPGLDILNFANGDQAAAEVRPGEWYVSFAPAGTDVVVFGPAMVQFKPFSAYLVFAVGSVDTGSFTLLTENVRGLKLMRGLGDSLDYDPKPGWSTR